MKVRERILATAMSGAALLALIGAPVAAQTQAQKPPPPPRLSLATPAPLTAADEAKLLPIAPELRASARMAIGFSKMMGTIDEAMVLKSRKVGGGGPPTPERMADVPVQEQMIPGPAAHHRSNYSSSTPKPAPAAPAFSTPTAVAIFLARQQPMCAASKSSHASWML